ncbi:hypothetical protein BGZ82_010977 [Podila clonocystis]|nr:hypothetical protein BGZ82_010977 [Podila clonocystis]
MVGLYPACNVPWIGTAVNKYVDNISQFHSQVDAYMCCLTPGDCTTNPVQGACPMGYLDCTFGNTRYACSFAPPAGQGPRCYSEGTLAHTRSLPCCENNLIDYLKTQPCTGGFSTAGNTSYCCTDKTAGSCVKCVTEIGLLQEVSYNCMSMTFPSSGCVLGGSGPALPPPGAITTTAVATTRPSTTTGAPTPTGPVELPKSDGGKIVIKKWVAFCMVAPALLQLVFL